MKVKYWTPLVIVFLAIPTVLPFLQPGLPSTHDGVTHVARFAQFHQALADGQIIPRWAGNVAFGLGSPVLMYNSVLPYLSAEIPKLLGMDWVGSVEFIFAFSFIASALTFYLLAKEIFGKLPALVGALFYIWAPYRFVDLYVRGAYPESFAFVFLPLVLLSAKKIVESHKLRWVLLAVFSLGGLILSHNVLAVLFMAIFFLYSSILALVTKKTPSLKRIAITALLSLVLTAFYWIPAFFEKGEVNLDKLNAGAPYNWNFANFSQVIYSKWGWGPIISESPMSPQLGLVQIGVVSITLLLTGLVFFKKWKIAFWIIDSASKLGMKMELKVPTLQLLHFLLFSLLLLMSVFLMTPYSQFLWENINLLAFFLYPWRWLTLGIFSSAVIASYSTYLLKSNKLVMIILIIALLYTNRNHLQLVGSVYKNDNFYSIHTDTTDMWGEFLPVSTNLEIINKCKKEKCFFEKVQVPSGVGVKAVFNKSNYLSFEYSSSSDFTATINTLYFPGWKLFIDGVESSNYEVNKLGTFNVPLSKGSKLVELIFKDTPLRSGSLLISTLTALVLVGFIWKKHGLV